MNDAQENSTCQLSYAFCGKHFTKFEILKIGHGLKQFLNTDSIIINQDTLNLIENETLEKIRNILEKFESVFVKLNFSAATDSDFLVTDLKCRTLDDILILLKGSNKLSLNLNLSCDFSDYLILKQWYQIEPKKEFRLFVRETNLEGISQRHINLYFSYTEDELAQIKSSILNLIEEIKPQLEQIGKSMQSKDERFFIDVVYLERKKRCKIIDIISETDRMALASRDENGSCFAQNYFLLFESWDSFKQSTNEVEFKVIGSQDDVITSKMSNDNKFPLELTETDLDSLINAINLK